MTTDLLELLKREAERVKEVVPGTAWYLFGSSLSDPDQAADWDVMVLCGSDDAVKAVRRETAGICAQFPIHLFLATREEEAELNFLSGQSCVPLDEVPIRANSAAA